ncbi:MAG TPA: hypothetical protein DEF88_07940, partial [Porphyromonadaceae bacterium]|nr:hypothetical protein [Porphyromonadaceae bacterium]
MNKSCEGEICSAKIGKIVSLRLSLRGISFNEPLSRIKLRTISSVLIKKQMKTTAIAFFAAALIFMSGCSEKKERLFNGKDLTNWNFVVENDAR